MWHIIELVFPYAIMYTVPLLITALGGLYSERSGIVNIGLEGLMIIGSFTGALTIYLIQGIQVTDNTAAWIKFIVKSDMSIWIGLLAAVIGGVLVSLLHAYASINLNANQVISGTAINMIAAAITVFLARNITGSGNIKITAFTPMAPEFLTNIPIIGPLFFNRAYWTTLLVLVILFISAFALYKTAFGLRLRSCGEYPQAAEAAGISVRKMRYIGVMMSGALAGLGGATILVTYSGQFTGSVSGLGFLALAALIFGQWKPFGILWATLFFGFATTIANVSTVIPALDVIPPLFLKIFPYVVTLIALIIFSKSTQAPKAAGEPFDSGKR